MDPKYNCKRASDKVAAFKNRECYEIEPLGLALSFNRIDPITRLPGCPRGAIIEFLGPEGCFKTGTHEHFAKHILEKNPKNRVVYAFFEEPNLGRMEALQEQGLDLNRVYYFDYSKPENGKELASAEECLNLILNMAAENIEANEKGDAEEDIVAVIIDSLGAMAVGKELYDDKGEFKSLDTTPQMAARAGKYTMFINQWLRLDPNTRPILGQINHYKIPIEPQGMAAYKNITIGDNLKHKTPCGTAKSFASTYRIKMDAKRIDLDEGKTKHSLFNSKIQEGLEVHYDVFKNKECADQGSRKVVGRFNFKTKRFDIEQEALFYAEYLGIDGIVKSTSGRWTIPEIDDKTRYIDAACEVLRERPEMLLDLKRKIALRSNELFSYKAPKKKTADKEL